VIIITKLRELGTKTGQERTTVICTGGGKSSFPAPWGGVPPDPLELASLGPFVPLPYLRMIVTGLSDEGIYGGIAGIPPRIYSV
jgi:hypothetical protein